jgi:hypothetical protein
VTWPSLSHLLRAAYRYQQLGTWDILSSTKYPANQNTTVPHCTTTLTCPHKCTQHDYTLVDCTTIPIDAQIFSLSQQMRVYTPHWLPPRANNSATHTILHVQSYRTCSRQANNSLLVWGNRKFYAKKGICHSFLQNLNSLVYCTVKFKLFGFHTCWLLIPFVRYLLAGSKSPSWSQYSNFCVNWNISSNIVLNACLTAGNKEGNRQPL